MPSTLTFAFAFLMGILVPLASSFAQAAAAPESPLPKGTGRLWNITGDELSYQIAVTSGSGWSAPIKLASGKYQEIRMPPRGQVTEIAGLHDLNPHVKIQFRQAGGVFRVSLPASTPNDEIVPQWFFVKDSNGFVRVVQAKSLAEGKSRQTELQTRPKMTPEEIERIKEVLRANYVLFDDR